MLDRLWRAPSLAGVEGTGAADHEVNRSVTFEDAHRCARIARCRLHLRRSRPLQCFEATAVDGFFDGRVATLSLRPARRSRTWTTIGQLRVTLRKAGPTGGRIRGQQEAAGQITQLGNRRVQVDGEPGQDCVIGRMLVVASIGSQGDLDAQRHEALLRAIVQVAHDSPPLRVRFEHDLAPQPGMSPIDRRLPLSRVGAP